MRIRPTTDKDLQFIFEAEHDQVNSRFVTPWRTEQHEALLDSPDSYHAMIIDRDDRPVGFVFVNGLTRPDRDRELKRLVVTAKGQGFGRFALRKIKDLAFSEWGALRLWLDVRDFNVAARGLYESEGFVKEGQGADNLIIYSMREG